MAARAGEARAEPPDARSPTCVLQRLDFMFFVENKPANVNRLRKLAKALGYDGTRSLVEGSVLSDDDLHGYYLYFHVDKREEDEAHLFAHLRYQEKPKNPPPVPMLEARARGATLQWAQAEVGRLTAENQRYLVEAQVVTPSRNASAHRGSRCAANHRRDRFRVCRCRIQGAQRSRRAAEVLVA
jgi:hypothetical protein